MFDTATIKRMNREAEVRSRREGIVPIVLTQPMIDAFKAHLPGWRFPHIGDRRPRGWKLVETLFCDSSGFGLSTEPALTIDQLGQRLEVGMGYATIETGQFQVCLGVFRPPVAK